MKTYNLLITGFFLLAVAYITNAQSRQQNYISTFIPTGEVSSSGQLTHSNAQQTVRYFDGLGRLEQTVKVKSNSQSKDLVSLSEYDTAGRNHQNWLPVPVGNNNGNYVAPANLKGLATTTYQDQKPFSHAEFDESPLNRHAINYGPGSIWEEYGPDSYDRPRYFTRVGSHELPKYLAFPYPDDTICYIGEIFGGWQELYVNEIWENGFSILEFRDQRGLLILKRISNYNGYEDTYFVYDLKGNLSVVLPPMAMKLLSGDRSSKPKKFDDMPYGYITDRGSGGKTPIAATFNETFPLEPIDTSLVHIDREVPVYHNLPVTWNSDESEILKKYGYFYLYDRQKRCIAKKLPGCDWIYCVYDKKGQLIFTQDGELRKKGKWAFYLPDELGRIVVTGTCENRLAFNEEPLNNTYVYQRFNLTQSGDNITPQGITLVNPSYLTVDYYDGRKFGNASSSTGYNPVNKGLLTATRVYDTSGNGNFTESEMTYDTRGRLKTSIAYNNVGSDTIKSSFSYNFNNLPLTIKRDHYRLGKPRIIEQYEYEYNHSLLIGNVYYKLQIDNQPFREILMRESRYNDLNQLSTLTLHENEETENRYTYHIRSFLTGISSSLFEQELYYEIPIGPSQEKITGDISAMRWKTAGDNSWRNYLFEYDRVRRLTKANYSEGDNMSQNVGLYNTTATYDANGNIQTFRQGSNEMAFSYNGNQLSGNTNVSPTSEITYNANGNLEKDFTKNIAGIEYNILNLPQRVQLTNGNTIEYMYYADGSKKQVTYFTARSGVTIPYGQPRELTASEIASKRTVEYFGSLVFENDNLIRIHNDYGYATLEANQPKYHYYYCDHQGNIRVVADQYGNIEETNHYYPFGSLFESSPSVQPHKYSGKELETEFNINNYDFSARWMNPAIGRFTTPDPMAEKYYSTSPYAYCANNPINAVDPTGMDYWSTNDPDEIERFMRSLGSFNGGKVFEEFDFSGWNHSPDADFVGNLTFNDENNTFYSSYTTLDERGEINVVGVSMEANNIFDGTAIIDGPMLRWHRRASGQAVNTYPEASFLFGATKSGWSSLRYLWNQMVNPLGTTNTFDAGKSGFAKGSTKSEKKINTKRADNWKNEEQRLRELKKNAKTKAEKELLQDQIKHAINKQKKSETHWRK